MQYSSSVFVSPGDSLDQQILLGGMPLRNMADGLLIDFEKLDLLPEPVSSLMPLRSGLVGCVKNVLINRVKPPYQTALEPAQIALIAMNSRSGSRLALSQQFETHIQGLIDRQKLSLKSQVAIKEDCTDQVLSGPCKSGPCKNGAACTLPPQQDNYFCNCQAGFYGSNCESVRDPCINSPCKNGAKCQALPKASYHQGESGNYVCDCPPGFSGFHCEIFSASDGDMCAQMDALVKSQDPAQSFCSNGAQCLTSGS
ncbi:hypothetical protein Ciccas_000988, partial [Cichlidogyrus casuarinus]